MLPLIVCTDSENLTQAIRRDAGQIQDKRLRIVIAMLRQTCEIEPSVTVRWVPTHLMVADALTKTGLDLVLIRAFLCACVCFPAPKPKPKKKPAMTNSDVNVTSVMRSPGAVTARGSSNFMKQNISRQHLHHSCLIAQHNPTCSQPCISDSSLGRRPKASAFSTRTHGPSGMFSLLGLFGVPRVVRAA